jgi:hypothetical protein
MNVYLLENYIDTLRFVKGQGCIPRDTLCQDPVTESKQGAIAEPRVEIGSADKKPGDAFLPVIPVTNN